jgi:uncharacterized glyoxalase superfamily protein PhnB
MTNALDPAGSPVIVTLRYLDVRAACDWLQSAFGFLPRLVVPGDGGAVIHAQLTFGTGMIMLGAARDDAFGKLTRQPSETGGSTESPYVIVADVAAHHARAVAAGARIVMPIREESYGGNAYSCCDPEGHLWNFGSYDPWAEVTPAGSGRDNQSGTL